MFYSEDAGGSAKVSSSSAAVRETRGKAEGGEGALGLPCPDRSELAGSYAQQLPYCASTSVSFQPAMRRSWSVTVRGGDTPVWWPSHPLFRYLEVTLGSGAAGWIPAAVPVSRPHRPALPV